MSPTRRPEDKALYELQPPANERSDQSFYLNPNKRLADLINKLSTFSTVNLAADNEGDLHLRLVKRQEVLRTMSEILNALEQTNELAKLSDITLYELYLIREELEGIINKQTEHWLLNKFIVLQEIYKWRRSTKK